MSCARGPFHLDHPLSHASSIGHRHRRFWPHPHPSLSFSSNTCMVPHLLFLEVSMLAAAQARQPMLHIEHTRQIETAVSEEKCRGTKRLERLVHEHTDYVLRRGTSKQVNKVFNPSQNDIHASLQQVKRSGSQKYPNPHLKNEVQSFECESNDETGLLTAQVDYIYSVNNAYVKHLVRLRKSASYRRTIGAAIVVGSTPLREICEATPMRERSPLCVEVLLVLKDAVVAPVLAKGSRRIIFVNTAVLHKLAGIDSSDSVDCVGLLKIPESVRSIDTRNIDSLQSDLSWFSTACRILVLDGIQDPGNLGTLLRTAAAFAWDGVLLLPGCCDPFNDKALRASRGAAFRIPIALGKWDYLQAFSEIHNIELYAANQAEMECGNTCSSISFHGAQELSIEVTADIAEKMDSGRPNIGLPVQIEGCENVLGDKEGKKLCLVLGSEGQGLSAEAKKYCQFLAIPMPGNFESLNVSVAGGILLFLLRKKLVMHSRT